MLVLTRRIGEEIVIGGLVRVRVIATGKGKAKLGVTAPEEISIHREEVHQALQQGFSHSADRSAQDSSTGSS
jgi:carbon storage regulator